VRSGPGAGERHLPRACERLGVWRLDEAHARARANRAWKRGRASGGQWPADWMGEVLGRGYCGTICVKAESECNFTLHALQNAARRSLLAERVSTKWLGRRAPVGEWGGTRAPARSIARLGVRRRREHGWQRVDHRPRRRARQQRTPFRKSRKSFFRNRRKIFIFVPLDAIVATDDCISERHSSVACRTLRHESFSKRIDDVTTADAALIVARSLVAQALSDNSHVASIAIFFRGVVGSTTSRSVQQRAGAALRYSHRRDQDVS